MWILEKKSETFLVLNTICNKMKSSTVFEKMPKYVSIYARTHLQKQDLKELVSLVIL